MAHVSERRRSHSPTPRSWSRSRLTLAGASLSQPFDALLRAGNDCLHLTESRAFRAIVSKAFDVCDERGKGAVDATELYIGVLLVHLNMAKFAGPAACYPPTRAVCDRLFLRADRDRSGGVDRAEFHGIAGVLCAHLLSRMLVYYLLLILCVPLLATGVVALAGIPKDRAYLELVTRESVSWAVFCLAVPLWWNSIDARYTADGGAGGGRGGRPLTNLEEQRQRRRTTTQRSQLQQHDVGELAI